LIDWEQGLLAVLQPWLLRSGVKASPAAMLQRFVAHEARFEAQSWRLYRDVLREVMIGIASDFAISLPDSKASLLVDSLPDWPPFPDAVEALRKLSKRFCLVIVSNTDDALFSATRRRLAVDFDTVITAEQVRSYKPGKAHFQEALRRLGVPVSNILHVAQSLYHDHVPAQELGFRTAWIKRASLLADTGLAPEARVKPDLQFFDLNGLAAGLGL
jgi:2-haloacid dehalogenase